MWEHSLLKDWACHTVIKNTPCCLGLKGNDKHLIKNDQRNSINIYIYCSICIVYTTDLGEGPSHRVDAKIMAREDVHINYTRWYNSQNLPASGRYKFNPGWEIPRGNSNLWYSYWKIHGERVLAGSVHWGHKADCYEPFTTGTKSYRLLIFDYFICFCFCFLKAKAKSICWEKVWIWSCIWKTRKTERHS